MRRNIVMTFLLFIAIYAVTGQEKPVKDPLGKWLFEAPYAPQGYTSGIIEISKSDGNLTATMAFTGNENKYPADKIKIENDTVSFNVYIEGQDVAVKLVFTDESKMAGKAVYTEGVVPLSLSREMKKN